MRLLVLIALLAAALPAAAGAAERKVPRGFVGVMWDKEIQDAPADVQRAQWERMARSGVESARVIFSWHLAQEPPGAQPDFSRTDQMVRNGAAHGIELLPVIVYAPPWARVKPKPSLVAYRKSARTYEGCRKDERARCVRRR